jgi:hypothetical protein
MPLDLQTAVAAAIVTFAAVFLMRRGVQTLRGKRSSGCGSSCGGCTNTASEKASVVQIQRKTKTSSSRRTE